MGIVIFLELMISIPMTITMIEMYMKLRPYLKESAPKSARTIRAITSVSLSARTIGAETAMGVLLSCLRRNDLKTSPSLAGDTVMINPPKKTTKLECQSTFIFSSLTK